MILFWYGPSSWFINFHLFSVSSYVKEKRGFMLISNPHYSPKTSSPHTVLTGDQMNFEGHIKSITLHPNILKCWGGLPTRLCVGKSLAQSLPGDLRNPIHCHVSLHLVTLKSQHTCPCITHALKSLSNSTLGPPCPREGGGSYA